MWEEPDPAHKQMGQFEEAFKHEEIITKFGDKNRASERTEIITSVEVKCQAARKKDNFQNSTWPVLPSNGKVTSIC